jgi:hypothetical protein
MFRQDFFGGFLIGRDVGLRKGNFEVRAQFPGKIAFALDPHRLARGAENAAPDCNKSSAHGCNAQSMDCGMTTSTPFFLMSGTGLGKALREKVGPTSDGGKWP